MYRFESRPKSMLRELWEEFHPFLHEGGPDLEVDSRFARWCFQRS